MSLGECVQGCFASLRSTVASGEERVIGSYEIHTVVIEHKRKIESTQMKICRRHRNWKNRSLGTINCDASYPKTINCIGIRRIGWVYRQEADEEVNRLALAHFSFRFGSGAPPQGLTPAALKTLRRKEDKKAVEQLYQSQSRFFPSRLCVRQYPRRGSNPQPSASEADALSN
jgi:hypothetical protein